MEQMDSIRGELQTLIALEQQQVETLGAIHSRGAFNPAPMQVGGFGYGQSHYAPNMSGFQNMSSLGSYANRAFGSYMGQVAGALNYGQENMPFSSQMNNFSSRIRNAMVNQNLDSVSFFGANQSKMSSEAREMMGANVGAKLSTGALSAASMFAGTLGGKLGSSLGSAMLGGLGGSIAGSLLFGAGAGALIGGTIDVASDQVKQNYAYDRYLLQNSSKFINVFESNNDRNVGGFSRKERWDTANWLRHFNTEHSITDDDTMTLLKGFSEGDLLREVSNVDQFKEKMSQLTDSVKSMALSLNETYENVAQMMADLKKKGIDQRDYKNIAASSKVIGGLTGQDAAEVLEDTTNLAYNIAQRYGNALLDPDKILKSVQGTTAYIGRMYENGDEKTRNLITNMGGQEAATAFVSNTAYSWLAENNTQFSQYSGAFVKWDPDKNRGQGEFVFDEEKYNKFKEGDWGLAELANEATNNLKTIQQKYGIDVVTTWTRQQGTVMQEAFGGAADQAGYMLEIINAAKKTVGLPDARIEDILQYFGYEGAEANLISKYLGALSADGGKLETQISAAGVAQAMVSDYQANHPGAGYAMKNWWGGVKDELGDIGDAVATPFRLMGRAIGDWWTGKPVEDMQQLWAETDWSKDPLEGFAESMSDYQKALFESGADSATVASANPLLFGAKYTNEESTRAVYASIDKLVEAIEELGGDTKKLSETIKKASKEGGVSENSAVAVIKALGITDADKASDIINQLSEEISKGSTEEEAVRAILTNEGITGEEQDKVVTDSNIITKNNSAPEGMNIETVLKRAYIDNAENPSQASMVNELLRPSSETASDLIPEKYVGLFEGVGAYSDTEKMEALSVLRPVLKESSDVVKDYLKNGENSVYASMGLAERAKHLDVLSWGYNYFTRTGEMNQPYAKGYFEGLDDYFEYESGNSLAVSGKLLFITDAERKIGNSAMRPTGGTSTYEDNTQKYFRMSVWNDTVNRAREGKYDFDGDSGASYSSLTPKELEKELDSKALVAWKEFNTAEQTFLNAESALKNYVENNYATSAEVWTLVESGDIASYEDYETHLSKAYEASPDTDTYRGLSEHVSNYFSAKESKDEKEAVKSSIVTAKKTAGLIKEQMEVYSTGFVSLGRVLGMDDETLERVKGNLSDKEIRSWRPDKDKTFEEMQQDIDETNKLFSSHLFKDFYNTEVTQDNRSAIVQQLASALGATREISSTDAQSMAETFVNNLQDGTKLSSDVTGEFINTTLSAMTFGTTRGTKTLEEELAANTEALVANTQALTGDEGEKIEGKGGGFKKSDFYDSSTGLIDFSQNNNGSTTSTSSNTGSRRLT